MTEGIPLPPPPGGGRRRMWIRLGSCGLRRTKRFSGVLCSCMIQDRRARGDLMALSASTKYRLVASGMIIGMLMMPAVPAGIVYLIRGSWWEPGVAAVCLGFMQMLFVSELTIHLCGGAFPGGSVPISRVVFANAVGGAVLAGGNVLLCALGLSGVLGASLGDWAKDHWIVSVLLLGLWVFVLPVAVIYLNDGVVRFVGLMLRVEKGAGMT